MCGIQGSFAELDIVEKQYPYYSMLIVQTKQHKIDTISTKSKPLVENHKLQDVALFLQ
jgi:hypothetical protein